MLKIEKQQMLEFLNNQDKKRYIDLLATMERPNVRCGDFYLQENDFIIEANYPSRLEYYLNLSCEENIKFFCELSKNKKFGLISFSKNIYNNPIFIESYGIIEPTIDKKYGLFKIIKYEIILPETDIVRRLTLDDCDIAEQFMESNKDEHWQPSFELTQYIECALKKVSNIHKLYGYFRNNIMTAFLTVYNNGSFWDIGYIYTSPEYLRNRMALNLAKYYINDFADTDVFISYGSAVGEASEKTALSAGFELFSTTYNY